MSEQQIIQDWLNSSSYSQQELDLIERPPLFEAIFTYLEHLKSEDQVFKPNQVLVFNPMFVLVISCWKRSVINYTLITARTTTEWFVSVCLSSRPSSEFT